MGASFRETNRSSEGVVETTSGLQYRVLREGEGKKPVVTDTVVVGYRGSLVNGEEFDSSHARGEFATVDLNQEELIAGWREALQLMREGAKLELVLPPELAYGARGNSDLGIGPAETLIYEIELISVK